MKDFSEFETHMKQKIFSMQYDHVHIDKTGFQVLSCNVLKFRRDLVLACTLDSVSFCTAKYSLCLSLFPSAN